MGLTTNSYWSEYFITELLETTQTPLKKTYLTHTLNIVAQHKIHNILLWFKFFTLKKTN